MRHRQYELVYIAAPETGESDMAELHAQIASIAERFGGAINKTEAWGRRRLAYDIGHHREGIYVLEDLTGPGDMIKEIDRRLKVIDHVIRHLVVRVDEDMRIAERHRVEREAAAAKRRAARGLPADMPAAPRRDDDEATGDADDQTEVR